MSEPQQPSQLETFTKQPLGGLDRRALVGILAERGAATAEADVAAWRAVIEPGGVALGDGACVLMLGGSNGILRAVAMQLVFGERVPVHCVHYDSEKLQVGGHYARAMSAAAVDAGVAMTFVNEDATKPETVAAVVQRLRGAYRCVHLINGIAAGAPKRYAAHGPTFVPDLDVAFDPVRQTPDFSSWNNVRRIGTVKVDVATDQDIERTNRMMGTSTTPWATALADAGLLVSGESLVAFTDYDFDPDDPVYAMGPLAGAKVLQREQMGLIAEKFGVRTVRICYPAMNTTAIGAIPGGLLMFAVTAQVLRERGAYRNLADLATETLELWSPHFRAFELRLDLPFASARDEFRERVSKMSNETLRSDLALVVASEPV